MRKYKYVNTEASLKFEWDSEKARTNVAKHGVAFEVAQEVWADLHHVIIPDRVEGGEQRWHGVGLVGAVVVLVVVHAYPDPDDESRVRIIGARKATTHERKRYEQDDS